MEGGVGEGYGGRYGVRMERGVEGGLREMCGGAEGGVERGV